MKNAEDVQNLIRHLFATQNLAVLATHSQKQPYASLVAYAATNDLKYLYFATPKTTRKFANMLINPQVAVLINSSTNQTADFHRAIAVTAVGEAEEVAAADREQLLPFYLAKHPYLEEFAKSPTTAVVQVTVRSYYLVKNFQEVLEFHIFQ
jgi:nitroimidazol reductase NimA-like FMN-containing flavoprotein (pyridoxamine 5'-phosphate oxidase superfamily)